MPIIAPKTVHDGVAFKGNAGLLKLCDDQMSFHTENTISVLPWKKVVQRQVASGESSKPMIKLILKSGTEAVFTMDTRVSLEVLRDDLGERLQNWRRLNPEENHVAVNKTNFSFSQQRRQSTPYRMVNTTHAQETRNYQRPTRPHRSSYVDPTQKTYDQPAQPRRASCVGPTSQKARQSNFKGSERTKKTSPPPFCRTLSAETVKKTNNHRSARYQ